MGQWHEHEEVTYSIGTRIKSWRFSEAEAAAAAAAAAALIRPLMQKDEQLSTGWTRADMNDIRRDWCGAVYAVSVGNKERKKEEEVEAYNGNRRYRI